jgi:phage FluMu protein Com
MIQSPPRVDQKPKCWRCGRLLAEYVARPWRFNCPRCKAENNSPPLE